MERTESIIQDFEWLLQVHRLLCKSFSIFSKSYSEWCDFCEFLTAEDIETEIKKLNTIFQNQSPYRVFLQYRGMFKNVKDICLNDCKGVSTANKKALELLLSGKCDEKKFNKDFAGSIKAYIWLFIRVTLQSNLNDDFNAEINDSVQYCNLTDIERRMHSTAKAFASISNQLLCNQELSLDEQRLIDLYDMLLSFNIDVTILTIVFELLNSRFVSAAQRIEVVNLVKNEFTQSFSSELQQCYFAWKAYVLKSHDYCIEDFVFSEQSLPINREYSFETNSAYRNPKAMCLDLTQKQTTLLYTDLLSKGYIPHNVDALDFGFAICGKPYQRKLINKIDWLKSKISFLTLFGELSNKKENQHYWCKLVNLFTWHGNNLTQQGLSSQYKKHVKEPPKRKNKEVEEIKEIVALIKSIKE